MRALGAVVKPYYVSVTFPCLSLSQAGSVRTRLDLLVRYPDRAMEFIEVKNGAAAALSRNQRTGFPIIRNGGAIPRGANAAAAGLEVGVPLPPIPVREIRY